MSCEILAVVDSHCHLDLIAQRNEYSIDELVANAKAAGVTKLLSIGIDQANSEQVVAIASKYDCVYASAGVHPCSANEKAVDPQWLDEWLAKPEVIAVGETGLDYFHEPVDKAKQWASFSSHLILAAKHNKPVIVHTRNAQADTIQILQEHADTGVQGVMHCFTEDWAMAEQALGLGFYISISGIVTFKNAEQVKEVVRRVPLERLLIETDSPYLSPVPFRGKTNQPAYVQHVAQCCADLKGIELEALAKATTDNFHRLFSTAV